MPSYTRFATAVASLCTLALAALPASAQFLVSNLADSGPGSLRQAILDADASPTAASITISAAGTLLAHDLPPITNPLGVNIYGTIDFNTGAPRFTVDAGGASRAFLVFATDRATRTARGNVSFSNLRIQNGRAAGGNGGGGGLPGGGGAGLGGGILVLQGNVSLVNVDFANNTAVGGNGGEYFGNLYGFGGGGGLGGNGGDGSTGPAGLRHGGGGGVRGNPDDAAYGDGGLADVFPPYPGPLLGFPGGGASSDGHPGATAGGGGAGSGANQSGGGGGVAGGTAPAADHGGNGGIGGGGGAGLAAGGNGGFGGGGAGSAITPGAGGFGGGGPAPAIPGFDGRTQPGFGGGSGFTEPKQGSTPGAGGGLGAGGAIFVRAGNALTLQDVTFSSNTVTGGNPTNGSLAGFGRALGQAIFLDADVTYFVSADKTITVNDTLESRDDAVSGGLTKTGNGTLVLTGFNLYTGDTNVQAGTLKVIQSISGSRSVNLAPNTAFEAAGTQRVGALQMANHATTLISAGVLTVGNHDQAIPITRTGDQSARIDLTSHALVVNHLPGAAATALDSIKALLVDGYHNGDWRGNGITSSAAAADPTKAVGYAPAAALLGPAGGAFLGQHVDPDSVLLRYTLSGDANLDGQVNFNDLVRLAQNYNTSVSTSPAGNWLSGDFTYDGTVDFNDLVKLAQNYNASLPATAAIPGAPATFTSDLATAFASVPEPTTAALIFTTLALTALRRTRRPAT